MDTENLRIIIPKSYEGGCERERPIKIFRESEIKVNICIYKKNGYILYTNLGSQLWRLMEWCSNTNVYEITTHKSYEKHKDVTKALLCRYNSYGIISM